MDESAVVGVQRLGLNGASIRSDGFCKQVHTVEEGIIAYGAVMLDIDDHPWRSMIPGLKDPIQQELEAI